MKLPDFKIEQEILSQDGQVAIGIDEAGRGPLAGPVVAGAVWVRPGFWESNFQDRELVRDSKTLSAKQREKAYAILQNSPEVVFAVGVVPHTVIDRVNILNATFLAMRFAVEELLDQLREKEWISGLFQAECWEDQVFLLVDGNRRIPKVNHPQRLFPRGDQSVFSIAAASIFAKVHRDRLMDQFHQQYPVYGFDQHRGYGTASHLESLKKHGPCDIHRKSFEPIKSIVSIGV